MKRDFVDVAFLPDSSVQLGFGKTDDLPEQPLNHITCHPYCF